MGRAVKAHVLTEPELEFCAGNRHIDPRFGLIQFGPADADSASAPGRITVGVVAPASHMQAARDWFERCKTAIDGRPAKSGQENMYPPFPGFSLDSSFAAELVFDSALAREIPDRVIQRFNGTASPGVARDAADLYAEHARSIEDSGRASLIVCVRPPDMEDPHRGDDIRDGGVAARPADNFHDLLKAKALGISRPLQLIRPETWTGVARANGGRRVQDEATRAWNLHTALYYKAGGAPWRIPRASTDLATCFVGVSFFRSPDSDELHTAVAQVFNERGDGVVVRGRAAHILKSDRQPHLSETDAASTLRDALAEFRRVHGHAPARVVVHKTSRFTPPEVDGFSGALDEAQIDHGELVWIQRGAGPRLFRSGQFSPLRGTLLDLDATTALLYTRGSIELFRTYPGMYVPQPLLVRTDALGTSPLNAARDILSLSKMNWNNAQLDERDPLTLRTARNVGDILRHVPPGTPTATRYAYYM